MLLIYSFPINNEHETAGGFLKGIQGNHLTKYLGLSVLPVPIVLGLFLSWEKPILHKIDMHKVGMFLMDKAGIEHVA